MSVTRYKVEELECCFQADMIESPTGEYVLHSDYARLKAEVERLTERNKFLEQIDSYLQGANENAYEKRCDELEAEVEELKRMLEASTFGIEFAKEDIKKLEAEVERLRKAGDAMQKRLYVLENPTHPEVYLKLLSAWNAAKEGKQS